MNKLIIGLMICMFMLSFASAEQDSLGTYEQNKNITLLQICGTCSYNNITSIILPNATHLIIDEEMTKRGMEYTYNFSQTDLLGTYLVNGFGDLDGIDDAWAYEFYITPDGTEMDLEKTFMYLFFLIFFLGLGFVYYEIKNHTDLEKWNNKIYQQYQDRNYIKLVLSAIGYNLMRNSFIIYYLLGLPIIFMLTEISILYDINSIIVIMESLIITYFAGLLLVGIMFLSYIQEWFIDLLNMVRDMDWGIER